MIREMHHAVDEVGAVVRARAHRLRLRQGRRALPRVEPRPSCSRLRKRLADHERYGLGDAYRCSSAARHRRAIVNAAGRASAALFTAHAAAVHPARLARGLADAVERLGGVVHEQTAVVAPSSRAACAPTTARCGPTIVVRATEAYTPSLDGHERTLLPDRELHDRHRADRRRHVGRDRPRQPRAVRGQRRPCSATASAPPTVASPGVGSAHRPGGARASRRRRCRRRASPSGCGALLVRPVPRARATSASPTTGAACSACHATSGPSVGLDRATGLAWAGGYFGAGVAPSNAAGRTLADLITGADSDLVRLPWVDHRSRPWEPEPLRWLGVHAVTTLARIADRIDARR